MDNSIQGSQQGVMNYEQPKRKRRNEEKLAPTDMLGFTLRIIAMGTMSTRASIFSAPLYSLVSVYPLLYFYIPLPLISPRERLPGQV